MIKATKKYIIGENGLGVPVKVYNEDVELQYRPVKNVPKENNQVDEYNRVMKEKHHGRRQV